MTRRRWIADEFSDDRAALIGAHAAHLARTLRAKAGQEFDVACGTRVRRGVIERVGDDRVEFQLEEDVDTQLAIPITLLLAVFKFDRMEWAIEKCTELNVSRIVPVIACRTEKHLAMAAEKRVERWRRIARESSEQSRRTGAPEIVDAVKLNNALALIDAETRLVLDESEHDATLAESLRGCRAANSLALAVGPEGGWTREELQGFAKAQWFATSLGDTILRAETAAIAAVAVARSALGA